MNKISPPDAQGRLEQVQVRFESKTDAIPCFQRGNEIWTATEQDLQPGELSQIKHAGAFIIRAVADTRKEKAGLGQWTVVELQGEGPAAQDS